MANKNIPAKDASGNNFSLRGQDNGDGTVSFNHVEDATQRAALLDQLAKLSTAPLQVTGNTSLATIATKLESQATAALQSTANTTLTSLATKLDTLGAKLDTANGRQGSANSVSGTITATGATGSLAVRGDFNITFYGTFNGTLTIERSFDNTVWVPLTALGSPVSFYTSATEIFSEPEAGVRYRLNCTALSSGTITWRISQ